MENCMRSSEAAGAGATRFGVGRGERRRRSPPAGAYNSTLTNLRPSPVSLAIALTSLLAAVLFVAYDTARTVEAERHELSLIGTMIAAEIAGLTADDAAAVLNASARRLEDISRVTVVPVERGDVASSSQLTIPAGWQSASGVALRGQPAMGDIARRAAFAFALAGLLTLVTWRPKDRVDAAQRRNYNTLAAAIPMGVACWTRDGTLVVCNEQYRQRLSLPSDKISYPEAVKRLIVGGYMKLLNEDENNRLLELHRQDGSCLLIDERPLDDGGFMTLVSDVTERKKTDTLLNAVREEQRLLARRYHEEKIKAEAASRAKTNFLAHLSHDIRTPLNHIIGFAELMRHETYGPLGDVRYADYVQSIKTSGEHLLNSFATILDLAELEGGQKALRTDPVPVDDLLDSIVQRFRGQAARAGLTFVLGEATGAVLHGDRLGLARMLANVVDNAIRFTPGGGRVTLAAFAARDGVVIEVTDTGLGMSEERLESLSQPFALGDATFTREGVGPGLGISISRAIAELSGGHMAIDSSPSLGTTVAISLPINQEAALVAAE
jgi:two-component system cell cycle sensor histidine kinase PleC